MSARTWIAPVDTALLSRLRYSCRRSLEALAFWVAVLFPVIYVVALVVGHRYASDTDHRS